MNSIRILLNLLVATVCFLGGIYLLGQSSIFLRDRWDPTVGLLFAGLSLNLLALAMFSLSVFVGTITFAWIRGVIPMPDPSPVRPHPGYKGSIIARYWYLIVAVLVFVLSAFMLAKHVPAPSIP